MTYQKLRMRKTAIPTLNSTTSVVNTSKVLSLMLLFMLISGIQLFAGKGALVTIYNLTAVEVNLHCHGFDDLKLGDGTIPAGGRYGSAYMEDKSWTGNASIKLNFDASIGSVHNLKITYSTFKYRTDARKDGSGSLSVISSINNSQESGRQCVVNIYILDFGFAPNNWMGTLADKTKLSAIAMPGTHDSGTYTSNMPYVYTQRKSIKTQLGEGGRYFDMRIDSRDVNCNSDLKICHGPYSLDNTLKEELINMKNFLGNNSRETILVQLKIDAGNNKTTVLCAIKNILAKNNIPYYAKDDIPNLGDVRGKIVFLSRITSDFGFNVTDWPQNDHRTYNRYSIQDNYEKVSKDNKLSYAKDLWSVKDENRYQINFLSYTALPFSPRRLAEGGPDRDGMNFLFADAIKDSGMGHTNIILMDFYDEDVAKQVIMQNYISARKF